MKPFFVLLLSCVATFSAIPMPELSRSVTAVATVISVHDGDTLSLAIGGAFNFVGPVRMANVHAMELSSAGGLGARANLLKLTPVGSLVRVRFAITHGGNFDQSLCRPLVDLWNDSTGDDICERQKFFLKANNWWGGKTVKNSD